MNAEALEGLFKLLFFFFGVCLMIFSLLFLPFAIQAHKARQKEQRDSMALKANHLGLNFQGESARNLFQKYLHIDQLDDLSGSDKHALNVMDGEFQGHPITLFDFHYATSGVWWWAPSWTIHHYASFVILGLDKDFPELTIGVEGHGLFKTISDAFGGGDIDFESHAFSKQYEVRSKNKKFAYDFCNAQMIDYFLDNPVTFLEVEKTSLAMGSDSQHSAGRLETKLNRLLEIRSLMPNYLFGNSYGGPEHVARQSSIPLVPDGSESAGVGGPNALNELGSDQEGYRWLVFYRAYLLLAVISGLISFRWGLSGMAVAKIALFVFAYYSLTKPIEAGTRVFHIAMNGAAVIMPLLSLGVSALPIPRLFYYLLLLPTPNFHSVFPFGATFVALTTIALAGAWCYFFVQMDQSEKADAY